MEISDEIFFQVCRVFAAIYIVGFFVIFVACAIDTLNRSRCKASQAVVRDEYGQTPISKEWLRENGWVIGSGNWWLILPYTRPLIETPNHGPGWALHWLGFEVSFERMVNRGCRLVDWDKATLQEKESEA